MPLVSRSVRLTAPAAGLLLGLLAGLADSLFLATNWWAARGVYYLPPFWGVTVLWTWTTACCLLALVVSWPRLGRARGVIVAFAAIAVLLLSRTGTAVKTATGWSTATVILLCVPVALALALPAAFLPLQPARHFRSWLGGTLVSTALLVFLAADVRVADFAGASASPSRGATQPNVVLIFLDTVRADDALGAPSPHAPNLVRFASGATSFDNAWAPAPWTIPSHLAVLTGVDPWTVPFDVKRVSLLYDGPTLAERFRSRGYATSAIYANPLLPPDGVYGRGYAEFSYSRASAVCRSAIGDLAARSFLNDGPRMPICGWLKASEVTSRALAFVRRAKSPYFLTLNYIDAHDPYYVPPDCRVAGYRAATRNERQTVANAEPGSPQPARAVARKLHEQYRLAMRCMDRSLGELLATIARDPNTVIAVVGDHGEQFGRHNYGGHGNSVYKQVLRVPLIMRLPGHPPAHVTEPVSITDLYLTMLRAADPAPERASLPLFDPASRRPVVSYYLYTRGRKIESGFSAVRGDLHYIHHREVEELYRYHEDPFEISPVSHDPHRDVVDQLKNDVTRARERSRGTSAFSALGYLN